MQSLIKKVVFLCLLVVGCCFMMSDVSYAKIHPGPEETTCETSTKKSDENKKNRTQKRKHKQKKDEKSSTKSKKSKKQLVASELASTEESKDELSDASSNSEGCVQSSISSGSVSQVEMSISASDISRSEDSKPDESVEKKEPQIERKKKAEDDSDVSRSEDSKPDESVEKKEPQVERKKKAEDDGDVSISEDSKSEKSVEKKEPQVECKKKSEDDSDVSRSEDSKPDESVEKKEPQVERKKKSEDDGDVSISEDSKPDESVEKKEPQVERKKKDEDISNRNCRLKLRRPKHLSFEENKVDDATDEGLSTRALVRSKCIELGFFDKGGSTTTTSVGHKKSQSKVEKSATSKSTRRSSALFSTSQVDIPEDILRDTDGIIENPIRKGNISLVVTAPALVKKTPGIFGISVTLKNKLPKEIDDISIYVQLDDDATELSFAAPVPIVRDITLVATDQYLYNIQVSRVEENVNRSFLVYVTHKAKDKAGEDREYLVAAHRQQFFLNKSLPNKAIIIVPGICGSELFSAKAQVINGVQYSKGYRIWPPEGVANVMEDGVPCCTSAKAKSKFVHRLWKDVSLISCTDTGESKASIMVSNPVMDCKNNPDRRNFGTLNYYSDLVTSILKSDYAKDSKVIFFSYDWRIGNKKVAKALKKFIDENDLTDVILVAHSMGGLVCSSFLADTKNCQNISRVIFLGTPFLGAAKAYNVLENGMFFSGIIGDGVGPIVNPAISLLARNWKSVYELLPPQQLFDIMRGPSCRSDRLDRGYLYTRRSKSNPLTSNYVLRDYKETLAIIQSRGWTPNVDAFLSDAQRFHSSLYARDGEIRFMKNRVHVYNVVGINVDTHSGYFLTYGRKSKVSCKEDQDNGDGTVTLISSTLFGNIPDKSTYYVRGVNHMGLIQHVKCLQLVNNIIDGHDERFDPTMIIKSYPSCVYRDRCCVCCFPPCLC